MIDEFVSWLPFRYRPRNRMGSVVVQQETNHPHRDAGRLVLRRGRTVNFAYRADGHMMIRRRAKQAARLTGVAFSWMAKRKEDRDVPAVARHQKRIFPWLD